MSQGSGVRTRMEAPPPGMGRTREQVRGRSQVQFSTLSFRKYHRNVALRLLRWLNGFEQSFWNQT